MVDRQSATEYRVVWQRVGYDKRRKIFGRRDAAERYVKRLLGEMPVLPDMGDDDDYACCSGWECGCGGQTVARAREEERKRYARYPALIYGPVLEERPVGDWETLSTHEPPPPPEPMPEPEMATVGAREETGDDVPF
jgi:hypothetical protein